MHSLLPCHSAFKGHATTKKRCALETRMAKMSFSAGNLLRAWSPFAYSKSNFPLSFKLHKEKTEHSKAWNPHHTPLPTINNYKIIAGHAQELSPNPSGPSCSKAVNVVGVKVYFAFLILLIKSIFSDNFLFSFLSIQLSNYRSKELNWMLLVKLSYLNSKFRTLYCYMRNLCNLIGSEQ